MNLATLKSLFMKIMIGCLIAAGAIAVITVLSGQFNEILGRSLATIGLIALHALASFAYIDMNEKQKSAKDLAFFTNAVFVIIVASFITSLFGLWSILQGSFVVQLYFMYGILLFAVLHGDVLAKTLGNEKTTDNIVYANYAFMIVVVVLLMPVVFGSADGLGDLYYRLLAAFGIVDAILTLIAVILNKMYLEKHPKANPTIFGSITLADGEQKTATIATMPAPKKRMNVFVMILIAYLVIQVVGGLVFMIAGKQAEENIAAVYQESAANNTAVQTYNDSMESDFLYNGNYYTCTRKIAGSWKRIKSVNRNKTFSMQGDTFTYEPQKASDVDRYCTTQ